MLIDSEKLKKVLIERLGVSGFKAVEVIRDIEDQEVNEMAEDQKGGAE